MDQTSTSASKPGTSKQTENLDPTPAPTPQPSLHMDEAMEVPPFRLISEMISSIHDSDPTRVSDQHSGQSDESTWVLLARQKNMQIKESTRLGPDTCLYLQRRISPLYPCKSLQNPLRPLLIKTNLNTIQTHFFIGKYLWLTYPLNMLKKWRPLGIFLISLTLGKPCPGLPLVFWAWMTKSANRSLGQEALLLYSP